MKSVIFYFTGSGNSFALASKLAYLLGDTKVIHISEMEHTKINEYTRIGIAFPVYGTHVPRYVENVLERIQFIPGQKLFLLLTYAGSRGYAMEETMKVIRKNNLNEIQEFCVRMPGSSLLEYGAFPTGIQKHLLRSADKKLKRISRTIKNEMRTKSVNPNLLAVLFRNSGIKMISEYGKKGSLFYAEEHCIRCGRCATLCALKNIEVTKDKVIWGEQCQQCMACILWCPTNAIKHPALKIDRKKYHNPEVNIIQDRLTKKWYSVMKQDEHSNDE